MKCSALLSQCPLWFSGSHLSNFRVLSEPGPTTYWIHSDDFEAVEVEIVAVMMFVRSRELVHLAHEDDPVGVRRWSAPFSDGVVRQGNVLFLSTPTIAPESLLV